MRRKWGRRGASYAESVLSSQGFLFTFFAIYIMINVLLFLGEAADESKRHEDFQKYTTAIARGCGATLNFNFAFVLVLASRSAMGFLRETPLNMVLPIDKAMPDLHRIVGMLLVLASIPHTIMHWVTYIAKNIWTKGVTGTTSLFATGMLLLMIIIVIRVAARAAIYHSSYEVFYRLHVGGSVLAYALILIHGLHRGTPSTWKWVVGPISLYAMDVLYRSLRQKRSYLLVSKHSAVFQSPDIIKLRLPRVFHFYAGQYAELKVPNISRVQWHPFTIASAPHEAEMIFYIKAVGDWTTSLYRLFGESFDSDDPRDIEVHIRGPFGAPAQHVGQFDRVILIGGGVGATPFCSVVKDAYNWITNWTPRRSRGTRGARRDIGNLTPSNEAAVQNAGPVGEERGGREESISNIFTTNVYSEHFESLEALGTTRTSKPFEAHQLSERPERTKRTPHIERGGYDARPGRQEGSSTYTARDYLVQPEPSSSSSATSSSMRSSESSVAVRPQDLTNSARGHCQTEYHTAVAEPPPYSKPSLARLLFNPFEKTSSVVMNNSMGSYHENSSGTTRRSLGYLFALHSAYSEEGQDEVFQRSLDLMLGMSFGSVPLVKKLQMRRTQRKMQLPPGEREMLSIDREDLDLLQSPRIMFLLFMRSVTVNMILLWILLARFTIAGVAYIFGSLQILEQGVALYSSTALVAVDLVLVVAVTILVGMPSVLEIIELGAAPVHGFDLFVLTPMALVGVVVDAIALDGVGRDARLFTVFHVFVIWPLLTIFVVMRLLRVIGERIAQAENLTATHSTTRKVDFFWTAPSPDDDKWLVDELRAYTNVESVQMHRYLTRCEDQDVSTVNRKRTNPCFLETKYGRPKWSSILNEMTEKCPNNTTIGVFFCGPVSMGEDVQAACMSAMRNSIVRGLHAGTRAMRGLEDVFGEAVSANEYTGDVPSTTRAGSRGCNVRIVFKRESFS